MADLTPEEKEIKLIAAIGKVTVLAKLEKFNLPADVSETVQAAFDAKKAELEAPPKPEREYSQMELMAALKPASE